MAIVVRDNFVEAVKKDTYTYFFETFDTLTPVYPQLFEVVTGSTGAGDKGTSAIGMGQLREREPGENIKAEAPQEGWTWYCKFKTFSEMTVMPQEFLDDINPAKIANFLQEISSSWAEGLMATKETAAANIFNNGSLTAGHKATFDGTFTGEDDPYPTKIYDNKPFFITTGSTGHPYKMALTTYLGNYTVSRALTADNLKTSYTTVTTTNAYNERQERIRLAPNVLVIPPALRFTARTILESTGEPDQNNNNINPVNNLGLVTVPWSYLTDADGWYLGHAKKGIRFYERQAPIITVWKTNENRSVNISIDARFGVAVTQWRYWYANNVAES